MPPQHAVTSASSAGTARGPHVEVNLPREPITLHGDHSAVERILTNLLDNAITHAHTRVTLTVRPNDNDVLLQVGDDGEGFAPDILPHVFDPFYRGDSARGPSGGAGLGLTIVRRLTKALGGDVNATNSPQGGALITVKLPNA